MSTASPLVLSALDDPDAPIERPPSAASRRATASGAPALSDAALLSLARVLGAIATTKRQRLTLALTGKGGTHAVA